jgi:hypothetical protein
MNILLVLKQMQLALGLFFGIKDIVEIFAISLLIYLFSRWLYQDTSKKLLLSFYGYCIALLLSFSFHLPTLGFVLLVAAPAAILLFITIHQKTLQKNFITFKKVIPAETATTNWDEVLVRECLVIANNNKEVSCLIEQRDAVAPFLESSIVLQCTIDHATLALITTSPLYQEQDMLIISADGQLTAVNATWKSPALSPWLSGNLLSEQTSLFYSTHFDCIALSISSKKRLFSLVFGGKKHDNLSASQALMLLRKQILVSSSHKEVSRGSLQTTRTHQRERSH